MDTPTSPLVSQAPTTHSTPAGKILVSWSLLPENKKRLEKFLDENLPALQEDDLRAKNGLKRLIRATFPAEALADIKHSLTDRSEYAVHVQNLPERHDATTMSTKPGAAEFYAFHISNALYEMFGAAPTQKKVETRSENTNPELNYTGVGYAHRDMLLAKDGSRSTHVMFSTPLNDSHAATKLVNMTATLGSICQTKPYAQTRFTAMRSGDNSEHRAEGYAVDAYEILRGAEPEFTLEGASSFDGEFNRQLAQYSHSVTLKPGEILLMDERSLFHQGTMGDKDAIRNVPKDQHFSRIILHMAGKSDGASR